MTYVIFYYPPFYFMLFFSINPIIEAVQGFFAFGALRRWYRKIDDKFFFIDSFSYKETWSSKAKGGQFEVDAVLAVDRCFFVEFIFSVIWNIAERVKTFNEGWGSKVLWVIKNLQIPNIFLKVTAVFFLDLQVNRHLWRICIHSVVNKEANCLERVFDQFG